MVDSQFLPSLLPRPTFTATAAEATSRKARRCSAARAPITTILCADCHAASDRGELHPGRQLFLKDGVATALARGVSPAKAVAQAMRDWRMKLVLRNVPGAVAAFANHSFGDATGLCSREF